MGGDVLVVAHGNCLRALVMALDDLDRGGRALELATGSVRIYEFAADTTIEAPLDRRLNPPVGPQEWVASRFEGIPI